jgi:PAS domain-containing protein
MGTMVSASICFVLVTLCGTIVLLQRIKDGRSRFLIGMVGLVAMFHGIRLLTSQGVKGLEAVALYSSVADFLVAVLTFIALLILHGEAIRHRLTRVQLRLSEANEQTVPIPNPKSVSAILDPNRVHSPDGISGQLPPEMVLDKFIQESPVAMVAFDENGDVCTCNRAAEELYGVGTHELLGKQLPALQNKPRSAGTKGQRLRPAEAHS